MIRPLRSVLRKTVALLVCHNAPTITARRVVHHVRQDAMSHKKPGYVTDISYLPVPK